MAIADASGFPIAAHIKSASPHEVKLVDKTIDSRFLDKSPDLLIGDKAYDSDPLDQRLKAKKGIEIIVPHKLNRKKPKTQDGRKLRRYRRRWKVECLFAWLHNLLSRPLLSDGDVLLAYKSAMFASAVKRKAELPMYFRQLGYLYSRQLKQTDPWFSVPSSRMVWPFRYFQISITY